MSTGFNWILLWNTWVLDSSAGGKSYRYVYNSNTFTTRHYFYNSEEHYKVVKIEVSFSISFHCPFCCIFHFVSFSISFHFPFSSIFHFIPFCISSTLFQFSKLRQTIKTSTPTKFIRQDKLIKFLISQQILLLLSNHLVLNMFDRQRNWTDSLRPDDKQLWSTKTCKLLLMQLFNTLSSLYLFFFSSNSLDSKLFN